MSVEAARALAAKVNKEFGEGAILLGSEIKIARRYTTGSLSFDVALGGGWPANQWSEVIGLESHGKTAIVLKTIAANQALDPDFTTFWVAAEHYDAEQAEALGVDNSRVIVFSTQKTESALEQMLTFLESRTVDCIVLDSWPALIPDEESDKGMDEAVMAIGARLFGKFFRKAGGAGKRDLTNPEDAPFLGIVINQWRDQIGGWAPNGGTPKTSPGGKAKNYGFWVRVEVKRDEWIAMSLPGKGKVNVGQVIKIKTIKNKSAAPQQVATVSFYFRDAPSLGFKRGEYDTISEVVTMGVLFDVIERRGAYFQWANGEEVDGKPKHRWQGKEAMVLGIAEDMDLREGITAAVLDAVANHDVDHRISDEQVDAAASSGTRTVKRRAKT